MSTAVKESNGQKWDDILKVIQMSSGIQTRPKLLVPILPNFSDG